MEEEKMRQYETFELTFHGQEPEGSQSSVDLSVIFTLNGVQKSVKGFYAGNGKYKVRYFPKEQGRCSWQTVTCLELDGQLSGIEECESADTSAHGMVKADGIHLKYEDGTRYIAVGTTVYAMVHQKKELVEETFGTLEKTPFNKIRFCVFPKHYDFNHNEPELFAFEKTDGQWDVNRPCFAFWDMFEEQIRRLGRMGIEADLILFHPYDHWGFAQMSKADCFIYLDYLLRRLSAIPNLWWSLANEYDLMDHFDRSWWAEFAEYIHENDPYGHMLSNHHCITQWDFSNENTTHCCLQSSAVVRTPDFQDKYGKPVIFDECCYEGNIAYNWGNISGREMVNRFWITFVLGGYCTHGETIAENGDLNDDIVLWWAKGGVLRGESSERIAFLRKIMEELPGDLDPVRSMWDRKSMLEKMKDPETAAMVPTVVKEIMKMPEEDFQNFMDGNREIAGHCGESVYMQYYAEHCTCIGSLLLPKEYKYDVEVIDTWEMTRRKVLSDVSGNVRVSLPGKEGMLVMAKRV